MRGRLVRVAMVVGALAAVGASSGPPTVELFTPTGTVEATEQVRVRFSEPMIAFGDPRAAAPVDGQCGAGVGRWVDAREWAFDFAAPLPGGLRCGYTLKPGLHTLAGAAVTGGADVRVRYGRADDRGPIARGRERIGGR